MSYTVLFSGPYLWHFLWTENALVDSQCFSLLVQCNLFWTDSQLSLAQNWTASTHSLFPVCIKMNLQRIKYACIINLCLAQSTCPLKQCCPLIPVYNDTSINQRNILIYISWKDGAIQKLSHFSIFFSPFFFFALGFKCPVCSKFVSSDEMDLHLVMCLTKPRITYNGKKVS